MKQLEVEFSDCLLRKAQVESNSSYYKDLVFTPFSSKISLQIERKRYIDRQIDLFQTSERRKILEGEIEELALPDNGQIEELEREYQVDLLA